MPLWTLGSESCDAYGMIDCSYLCNMMEGGSTNSGQFLYMCVVLTCHTLEHTNYWEIFEITTSY